MATTANTVPVTSAGTTLFISAALPATYDETGYSALTWTEVGEITEYGEFGKKYNVVKHMPVAKRSATKRKGSYENGVLSLKMAKVPKDAGQIILKAAADSDSSYSIKVVTQGAAVTFYTTAQITSFTNNIGNVDSMFAASVDAEIDRDIVVVEAA